MQEKPTIQQLENFLLYGKVRNFAASAHLANITQSAFSFQMKKLESALGVQLIARYNRGSELTAEGEEFLEHLTPIMQELDDLLTNIQQAGQKSIDIKVGALMSMGDVLLNRHVNYFGKNNPNIKISIYTLEAQSMLDKLEHGVIDIATSFLLPQMHPEGCVKTFCYQEELVYYAPKLPVLSDVVSPADIAKYPLTSYSPDYFMSKMLHQYFIDRHLNPAVDARLSSPYAIMHYCQCNPSGALLSEHMLNEMNIYTGYYHLNDPFYLDCYLLYKPENPKLSSIEVLIDYLVSSFNKKED